MVARTMASDSTMSQSVLLRQRLVTVRSRQNHEIQMFDGNALDQTETACVGGSIENTRAIACCHYSSRQELHKHTVISCQDEAFAEEAVVVEAEGLPEAAAAEDLQEVVEAADEAEEVRLDQEGTCLCRSQCAAFVLSLLADPRFSYDCIAHRQL